MEASHIQNIGATGSSSASSVGPAAAAASSSSSSSIAVPNSKTPLWRKILLLTQKWFDQKTSLEQRLAVVAEQKKMEDIQKIRQKMDVLSTAINMAKQLINTILEGVKAIAQNIR